MYKLYEPLKFWPFNLSTKSHLYRLLYIFQVVIEIPYNLAQAVIYCLLVYSLLEFQWTALKIFWYIFFTFFTLLYFTYYGMMSVALTPNAHIASVTAAAFYSIWNIFAGFVIPRTVSVVFLNTAIIMISPNMYYQYSTLSTEPKETQKRKRKYLRNWNFLKKIIQLSTREFWILE